MVASINWSAVYLNGIGGKILDFNGELAVLVISQNKTLFRFYAGGRMKCIKNAARRNENYQNGCKEYVFHKVIFVFAETKLMIYNEAIATNYTLRKIKNAMPREG